ncbi:MAG: dephospho-CoA kinase [Streptococcaceae bacterium]|nr:dephospho-CoA kinase [Streptococcaceae bacterium]MCL2681544.1 dephospho-CoA kinase [Streptococcaceae bacterium]
MTKVIGLTGGIATGKSTATAFLETQNCEIIDADKVVRELQLPDGILSKQIKQIFGADFFDEKGQLIREKLSQLILADEKARFQLEKLQDEIIRKELYARRDKLIEQGSEIIIMDIPLLFEREYTGFDEIWLIYVPENEEIKRLMNRNAITKEKAESLIALQWSIEKKKDLAHRVFDNSKRPENLEEELKKALNEIERK